MKDMQHEGVDQLKLVSERQHLVDVLMDPATHVEKVRRGEDESAPTQNKQPRREVYFPIRFPLAEYYPRRDASREIRGPGQRGEEEHVNQAAVENRGQTR